jgi:DNA-binding LacI/PurR family transcriptional regulator
LRDIVTSLALGLIHAFRDAGLDVPGDISVVGFDDVPDAAHYWPPLTTVRQDFAEIGRRSVAMLLAELNGQSSPGHEPILPELIVRSSTSSPHR